MSYIGNTSVTQAFTPAIDYFSGTGSATAFTLSRPVASVAQVQVVVNNVAQNPSSAYTVSSNTITFTSAPSAGTNNIYVYYTSPITQVIAPGQGTVGVTQLSATGTASSTKYLRGDNTWSSPTTSEIQPISASVAANALTISASALTLDFRSTTLSSGTVTTVSGTPASLVVPSTATLGTVNAVQSRLVVIALNNAGTIELAVVNISGGTDLTETGLISTTAISASSTSASTVYSTSARTSVAYRVIGYVESTQATAGTWATAPSTIQGYGGQALAAMSSIGYGQTWQSFTVGTQRVSGTTYYNTTGKPITVAVNINNSSSLTAVIGGVSMAGGACSAGNNQSMLYVVPVGVAYSMTGTFNTWHELR
jgi:hypothetical protein